MAKIQRNIEQEQALKLIIEKLREIAQINKILSTDGEEYVLMINGSEKAKFTLSSDQGSNLLAEIAKSDKKIINENKKKHFIELDDEEEALVR